MAERFKAPTKPMMILDKQKKMSFDAFSDVSSVHFTETKHNFKSQLKKQVQGRTLRKFCLA